MSCPVDTPSCTVFSLRLIPERATAAPVCHFQHFLIVVIISIAQRHTLDPVFVLFLGSIALGSIYELYSDTS
ncbi:hypothetical protein BDW71DRAFT_182855 [Aspergillus fruticulosus]